MSNERPNLEKRAPCLQIGASSSHDRKDADPVEPTPMLVTIDNIKAYDRNPRRERNEAHDLITESIRQRGFTGALPITRRPGDPLYMVAEGGNTVLQILKALYAETQDPRFHEIQCLYEPWVSESETLIAHLVENDARADLIFIDRARAVQDLRALLEQERRAPLSTRQLAALLREQGYSIDQSMILRLLYAVEVLLPLIPRALRAGLGALQVKHLRKLEDLTARFLEHRGFDAVTIEAAKRWLLECLARHDSEDWLIEPIEREVETQLAEVCGESIAKVRADLDSIKDFGSPAPDAPPPTPFNLHDGRASEAGSPERHGTAQPSERGTRRADVDVTESPPASSRAAASGTASPRAQAVNDEVSGDGDSAWSANLPAVGFRCGHWRQRLPVLRPTRLRRPISQGT